MNSSSYLPLTLLCTHYEVEMTFFSRLSESGLLEIVVLEKESCIHEDSIADVEKMIRMHRDLDLNVEGIDVVFHLLKKIDRLEAELQSVRNRLDLVELPARF
ncbi:MAG: chaperone modulator CbpM [Bacteroidia bacterium]|nr:chaperone modulator CbpM [Bacteroidia bacterium]